MQIDLLTLFPEFFRSPLSQSMLQRAQAQGAVNFRVVNLRDYAGDRHQVTDDRPFGGGPGMVMKIEPLAAAIRAAREDDPQVRIILLSPPGRRFNQAKARELAGFGHLLLICGHYEGVDERVHFYIDGKLSIGDYILTGGEIPALIVLDAVTRLLPGVLGGEGATEEESFQKASWNIPITPGPGFSRATRCPRSCWRATTGALPGGGAGRPWPGRAAAAGFAGQGALAQEDREFIKSLAQTPEEDR